MKGDKGGEGEAKSEEEEKRVHFFSYMDRQGRLLVPLRNRKEAGIENLLGADVEVEMVVRKEYRKKKEEEER